MYLIKINLLFAHENIKVAHNRPQTFFSQVRPGCPNQPRIDFSSYYYSCSGRSLGEFEVLKLKTCSLYHENQILQKVNVMYTQVLT